MRLRWEQVQGEDIEFPSAAEIGDYLITRYEDKRRTVPVRKATLECLHALQKGLCAICEAPITIEKGTLEGRRFKAHLDHDHTTEKERGLLCNHCNLVLGFANDRIKVLERAIVYLRTHGQV